MAIIAGLTIVTWLAATLITPRNRSRRCGSFFKKIRPGGPGWKPIAAVEPDVVQDKNLGISIVGSLVCVGHCLFTLPAIGYFIFGQTDLGLACI